MISKRDFIWSGVAGLGLALTPLDTFVQAASAFAVTRSDAEWRKILSPAQFAVLRRSGTERPYSSALLKEKRQGVFACAGCSQPLFSSETKYDSRTGWPSFWAPLDRAVGTEPDNSLGIARTAVFCSNCGGHQGHVFQDGPQPTGLRYCMNGVSMRFRPGA